MTATLPKTAGLFIEINQVSLKALSGAHGLEVPLERAENGRITPASRQRSIAALEAFCREQGVNRSHRVYCAIDARGVSLRRLKVPPASGDEFQRMLLLQIEREFPLPPVHMAWGFRRINGRAGNESGNGSARTQEVIVAAVRKELLLDYAEMLSACGLKPVFTLAAMARTGLALGHNDSYTLLDVVSGHTELLSVESGDPTALRSSSASTDAAGPNLEPDVSNIGSGSRLYISGEPAAVNAMVGRFQPTLGSLCEPINYPPSPGRSAATLGLAQQVHEHGGPLLTLEVASTAQAERSATGTRRSWALVALILLAVSIGLRYAEAFVDKSRVGRRIAEMKAYRDKLPNVDRELAFLQYLKTNQPLYLETVAAMADAAAPGTRIESLSLSRRGEMSLRASMRDGTQVGDFRTKLIQSGLFSSVVVEEQTPTPDRQKVNIRIAGQWKPMAERKPAPVEQSRAPGRIAPTAGSANSNSRSLTNTAERSVKTNTAPSSTQRGAQPEKE